MNSGRGSIPDTIRHFTASGYVIHSGRALLHWHPKVGALLPPGGHIEPNEDPAEAVRREVKEETGLSIEVLSWGIHTGVDDTRQVPPPAAIRIEDINDPEVGAHQHIDMIYFCRVVGSIEELSYGWSWIGESQLRHRGSQPGPRECTEAPEDVRRLALEAIRVVRELA